MIAAPIFWLTGGLIVALAAVGLFDAMMRPIPRARLAGFAAALAIALTIDGSRHAIYYAALAAQSAALDALAG